MRIIVNGIEQSLNASTLQDLLWVLNAPEKGVAVERNREIIPKSQYKTTLLMDDDEIEIVQFVGGG